MVWRCRVCGLQVSKPEPLLAHLKRCVPRNEDRLDTLRTPQPFEGDPELAMFAAAEGDVYNRRAGTRKRPR